MSAVRVGVVTIAAGRHGHLRGQLEALRRSRLRADVHVVGAMGDDRIAEVVAENRPGWPVEVVPVETVDELPLARARNRAAARAIERGADLLVFLDVDCIPAPDLLERYRAASAEVSGSPTVLCGPVHYLPPAPGGYPPDGLAALAGPHPARPAPSPGELVLADDLRLFWSLSFAITSPDWQRTGGFCEDYEGYGGEDTDFAMTLQALGGRMFWVGGASAFHQHHPIETPPTRHVAAIVRNANLFHRRWGWFAMEGWLSAFAEMGLAHLDTSGVWVSDPISSR